MELIQGETLRECLTARAAWIRRRRREITAQVAEALDYAHNKGVIHRDLKPSNIMLEQSGGVKVMDYGIARAQHLEGLTTTGSFLGTPSYAAPETVDAGSQPPSDLYSLGVVFFEMLTGSLPFRGDSAFAMLRHHCTTPPPVPSSLNYALSAGARPDRAAPAEQGSRRAPDRRAAAQRADRPPRGVAVSAAGRELLAAALVTADGRRRRAQDISLNRARARAPGRREWATPSSPSRTTARPRPGIPPGLSQLRKPEFSLVHTTGHRELSLEGYRTRDESSAFTTLTTGNTVADIEFASAAVPFSEVSQSTRSSLTEPVEGMFGPVTLHFPGSIGLGVAWRPKPLLQLALDFTYDEWTQFLVESTPGSSGVAVSGFDNLPPDLSATRDTVTVNAGMEKLFPVQGKYVPLRLGASYEPQGGRDPLLRDGLDYSILAAGTGLNTNSFKLDLAVEYRWGSYHNSTNLSPVYRVGRAAELGLPPPPEAQGSAALRECASSSR